MALEIWQGPRVSLMPTASCRPRESRRAGLQGEIQTGRERRVSEHRRQCAQCAGTREAEPREGLAEASSSWGQAQLPAPTPDKERPGPGELAAFPPLGAPGWGGLSVREAGALSNSVTATAGQAAAWQPVRRRQGWRA